MKRLIIILSTMILWTANANAQEFKDKFHYGVEWGIGYAAFSSSYSTFITDEGMLLKARTLRSTSILTVKSQDASVMIWAKDSDCTHFPDIWAYAKRKTLFLLRSEAYGQWAKNSRRLSVRSIWKRDAVSERMCPGRCCCQESDISIRSDLRGKCL